MARRKNPPESVRMKCNLAERLRQIRTELYGERGGPELSRRLGLPIRTWYNYESGVTVPGEVLLRFVELTSVEPMWLLHGRGPRFRNMPPLWQGSLTDQTCSVEFLLRAALQRLEQLGEKLHSERERSGEDTNHEPRNAMLDSREHPVLYSLDDPARERLTPDSGPRYAEALKEWEAAKGEGRWVQVVDQAMMPVIPQGAAVVFSENAESARGLDGRLVVAWRQGLILVRWLNYDGRNLTLRAESDKSDESILFIPTPEEWRFRRALWVGLSGSGD